MGGLGVLVGLPMVLGAGSGLVGLTLDPAFELSVTEERLMAASMGREAREANFRGALEALDHASR